MAARLIVGCLLALLGCAGGSGSSGFDLAENGAIDQALNEERCVESDGLLICPADGAEPTAAPSETPTADSTAVTPTSPAAAETPTPTASGDGTITPTPPVNPGETATPAETGDTPTPTTPADQPTPTATGPELPRTPTRTGTPTPTPTPTFAAPGGRMIDTSIGEDRGIECAPDGGSCSFELHFSPQGFEPGTAFQVAARLRDPDGEWLLFSAEEVSLHPAMPAFRAIITLMLDGRGEGELVAQVAVLAYSTAPGAPSAAVDSLGASGANFAFVTGELLVTLGP